MQDKTSIDHDSGWTGYPRWAVPGESLLSCLLKLAWANAATAREISHRIFGSTLRSSNNVQVHPRSFLISDWTYRFPARNCPSWVNHLVKELNRTSSQTITSLCTDRSIKYCQLCLSNGVHFPEFQIEALSTCPIHEVPLISSCISCGKPTSRYALCEETFANPFYCWYCGFSQIGKITPDKFVLNEHNIDLSRRRLKPLQAWVKQVTSCGINWVDHDGCLLTDLEVDPIVQRKIIFCLAAEFTMPLPKAVFKYFSHLDTWQIWSVGVELNDRKCWVDPILDELLSQRISIYKSIRKYIYRKYIRIHKTCFKSASGGYVFGLIEGSALPDAKLCLWAQSWMLWRSRFEDMSMGTDLWCKDRNHLPTSRQYKGGIDDLNISNLEWSVLVLYSFHASFRTLRLWMLSRWTLTSRNEANSDSIQFATVPAPFLQLILVSQRHLEVQMATLVQPSAVPKMPAQKFLVGANESNDLIQLQCVCNPYFPRD